MKQKSQTTLAVEVQMFKALADETRLKILALLSCGELCVCDIMEILKLPQSTSSRHLAYLKNSYWVVGRRSGKWMYYKLNPDLDGHILHKAIIENISALEELQVIQKELETYLHHKNAQKRCS